MLKNKPIMGWNSWNTFGENINEQLIMEIADTMVSKGYKEAGYEYVIIDDCWALRERDEQGKLAADPKKFPHGMKYLADYIHSKGLKFGMYSCSGTMTCAGYPGSYGHEYVDAQTFAEWGIDYLKYDNCHFPLTANCKNSYLTMSIALRSTGRDIYFAACDGGKDESWNWMRSVGTHSYRSTPDIFDNFKSFQKIATDQENNFSMSAPGCINDLDMLVVGMYGQGNVGIEKGCTDNEYALHFALWCMYQTVLIIGGDIRSINDCSKKLLQNKELAAINQDSEMRPPVIIKYEEEWLKNNRILFKILSDSEYAVMFINYGDEEYNMPLYFKDIGIPYESNMGISAVNVMTGEKLGILRDYYMPSVKPHSFLLLKGKLVHV